MLKKISLLLAYWSNLMILFIYLKNFCQDFSMVLRKFIILTVSNPNTFQKSTNTQIQFKLKSNSYGQGSSESPRLPGSLSSSFPSLQSSRTSQFSFMTFVPAELILQCNDWPPRTFTWAGQTKFSNILQNLGFTLKPS